MEYQGVWKKPTFEWHKLDLIWNKTNQNRPFFSRIYASSVRVSMEFVSTASTCSAKPKTWNNYFTISEVFIR